MWVLITGVGEWKVKLMFWQRRQKRKKHKWTNHKYYHIPNTKNTWNPHLCPTTRRCPSWRCPIVNLPSCKPGNYPPAEVAGWIDPWGGWAVGSIQSSPRSFVMKLMTYWGTVLWRNLPFMRGMWNISWCHSQDGYGRARWRSIWGWIRPMERWFVCRNYPSMRTGILCHLSFSSFIVYLPTRTSSNRTKH